MKTTLRTTLSVCATVASMACHAGAQVPGEKLDSGLGQLPHYANWADPTGRQPVPVAIAGESLDSGLGELPHYRHWKDKTGKDPMSVLLVQRRTVASR